MAKHSFSTILYRPSLLTSTFSPGGNCLSLAPLLYSRCTLLGPEQILTWQLTHCVEFWSQDHDILNSVLTGTTYLLPVFLQVEQVVVSCQTAAWREKIPWRSGEPPVLPTTEDQAIYLNYVHCRIQQKRAFCNGAVKWFTFSESCWVEAVDQAGRSQNKYHDRIS